jgi:hypothetical protein
LAETKYRSLNHAPSGALDLIEKAKYSRSAYKDLETSYRGEGLEKIADEVYVSGKWREGSESSLTNYLLNRFLYLTVGYGKYLWFALIWSFSFIAIGSFIFLKEGNMLIRPEDKDHFEGMYNPVWYSIALFLPIVSLEDTKIWRPDPKCKWQWRRHYMRLHVIVGYLLIPLGLAAWTGLIK